MSKSKQDLREGLKKLYNESRQLGMLRQGSPIDHMIDGAMDLTTAHINERVNKAESNLITFLINHNEGSLIAEEVTVEHLIAALREYRRQDTKHYCDNPSCPDLHTRQELSKQRETKTNGDLNHGEK